MLSMNDIATATHLLLTTALVIAALISVFSPNAHLRRIARTVAGILLNPRAGQPCEDARTGTRARKRRPSNSPPEVSVDAGPAADCS